MFDDFKTPGSRSISGPGIYTVRTTTRDNGCAGGKSIDQVDDGLLITTAARTNNPHKH